MAKFGEIMNEIGGLFGDLHNLFKDDITKLFNKTSAWLENRKEKIMPEIEEEKTILKQSIERKNSYQQDYSFGANLRDLKETLLMLFGKRKADVTDDETDGETATNDLNNLPITRINWNEE